MEIPGELASDLVEAGDAHAAWAAADAAVRHSPRARFLSYLADVEHQLDHQGRARERYRQALALDPHDVDWDELADEDVSALPDIARTELQLADGVAWAAPVGVGRSPPNGCSGGARAKSPARTRTLVPDSLRSALASRLPSFLGAPGFGASRLGVSRS
jgi:uncharacterized membrane-anchored protein